MLQSRFAFRRGKRPQRLMAHPRFRAAYDFYCLRAEVGEADAEIAQWWTDAQNDPANLPPAAESAAAPARRRRRRRGGAGNSGQ